jgi:probable rRNA maturation factor
MPHHIDLQVACTTDQLPSQAQLQLWVETALSTASQTTQTFELTIRLVEPEESQQLNNQFRGQNKPTNVLSFPFEVPEGLTLNLLGDLVICVDIMKNEAKSQNKKLFDHWAHLVIHGCLHLLGFDHISDIEAVEMEAIEVAALAKLHINNPYLLSE